MRRIRLNPRAALLSALILTAASATAVQRDFAPDDLAAGRLPERGTPAEALACAAVASIRGDEAKANGREEERQSLALRRDSYLNGAGFRGEQFAVLRNLLPAYKGAVVRMGDQARAAVTHYCG